MAVIKIGGATSLSADSWKTTLDDRSQLIQTDGGNVVQDYGHVASGDKMTVTCNWLRDDFLKVWRAYEDRTMVDVTDPAGVVWPKCRVKIQSYGYFAHFEDNVVHTDLEIWRI